MQFFVPVFRVEPRNQVLHVFEKGMIFTNVVRSKMVLSMQVKGNRRVRRDVREGC